MKIINGVAIAGQDDVQIRPNGVVIVCGLPIGRRVGNCLELWDKDKNRAATRGTDKIRINIGILSEHKV